MKNNAAMLTGKFNFQNSTFFRLIALINRYKDVRTSTIIINGKTRTDFSKVETPYVNS